MNAERLILIFLGMFLVTYLPRLLPLFALSQVRLPDRLMSWLSYLPAAILSALIFPGALMRDGVLDPGIGPLGPGSELRGRHQDQEPYPDNGGGRHGDVYWTNSSMNDLSN
jgi:hypothetical protein